MITTRHLLRALVLAACLSAGARGEPAVPRESVAAPAADVTPRAATQPTEPAPARFEIEVTPGGERVAYLVAAPSVPTPPDKRWMVVFLHGAGGSINRYNLMRPQYARIRSELAAAGAYVVVPGLGGVHFMNDAAKAALSRVIEQVATDEQIDRGHVHLMGTSMGAGSVLAYAASHPGAVRSVCAIMPMTDFAVWGVEKPAYGARLNVAYGGTPEARPEAYDANSALRHADVLSKIPIYLLHGAADRTVPPSHSEKLAAALTARSGKCTFVEVEGVGHTDDIVTPQQDAIARFLIDANR